MHKMISIEENDIGGRCIYDTGIYLVTLYDRRTNRRQLHRPLGRDPCVLLLRAQHLKYYLRNREVAPHRQMEGISYA